MERVLQGAWLPAVLLAIAPSVLAGQVEHTVNVGPIPVGGTGTATFPQFDPSLGVLRNAHFEIATRVSGTIGFENTTGQPVTSGGYTSQYAYGMYVLPWFQGSPIMTSPMSAVFFSPVVVLTPYDGTTDYAGTSGVTHAFANETGDGNPTGTADMFSDQALQAFRGTGAVSIVLGPTTQAGPNVPAGIATSGAVAADAIVRVRYEYDAFPTSICNARFGSGCPCGNFGMQARGCGNSVNANGGALSATGNASIANDTLVLAGDGMTPSSSALYFQGTTFQHAQIVYGDGLRCVTGNVVRLGTRMNSGGASSYPQAGDPSVSVRGGVAAPGTRFYQVSYRDLGNYCTAATFNVTSGVAILWSL